MHPFLITYRPLFVLLSLAALLSACSLNVDRSAEQQISQEDIELVSDIIGESLSDDRSGILGSMYDAISGISSRGFVLRKESAQQANVPLNFSGRGNEQNLSYLYFPAKGEHQLSFLRVVELPNFIKRVQDTLRYVYTNEGGNFITDPISQQAELSRLSFFGTRHGEITEGPQNSAFTRSDSMRFEGLSEAANFLQINGTHQGSGVLIRAFGPDSILREVSYNLEVDFVDIRIDKNLPVLTQSLDRRMTGLLSYRIEISLAGSDEQIRQLSGSIDLVGDGTAVLRLPQQSSPIQVGLQQGSTFNNQTEFVGQIQQFDLANRRLQLFNGLSIVLTEDLQIDDDSDFSTLEAASNYFSAQNSLRAEGYGNYENGLFICNLIEFERIEADDNEADEIEFEQPIQSINLGSKSLILASGLQIQLSESTQIDEDSDFSSLEDVNQGLQQGQTIIAEGYARYVPSMAISFQVDRIEFELEDDHADDSGSEDEEDEEDYEEDDYDVEFNGYVQQVSALDSIFTLSNGLRIRINTNTRFEDQVQSLQQVEAALASNKEVEVDGYAITDPQGIANYLALTVDFEWEEESESESENENENEGDDDSDNDSEEEGDEDNDDGDNDGNEDEEDDEDNEDENDQTDPDSYDIEYEGYVQAVDLEANSFQLADGTIMLITTDTVFEGSFSSLQEVANALNSGSTIKVDGYANEDPENQSRYIALTVDFELEDEEDDDDE